MWYVAWLQFSFQEEILFLVFSGFLYWFIPFKLSNSYNNHTHHDHDTTWDKTTLFDIHNMLEKDI